MTTGAAHIDLTRVPPHRRRRCLAQLALLPYGSTVVLVVGALPVDPALIWELSEHGDRLHVDIQGSATAHAQWLDALRHGCRFSALTLGGGSP